ncbi:Flagellar motor switch protein FliG [Aquimixticola soesokkakensis]|uniref:Flagellar motor switch protein FliG n=1 Tax=Aquimixticola soesokkakensis TaxID=1519096 RepID=A0A1Y5SQC3_9RHOB|nr:FliG C-terminal domain-containing protein [Aquimixticola soesokkakensis]SLN45470.1 Flagellar motor switch protein FliG [Aquimixticola soesokkakensis]
MNALPKLGSDFPPIGNLAMGGGAQAMTKKQKAAIVVRLLAAEGIRVPLSGLSEEMQVDLARQLSEMHYISRETLRGVVEEFVEELDAIGLAFPGGLEGALNLLEGSISAATSAKLRKQAGYKLTGDPWERISDMDTVRLLPILEQESVQVGAVLLSKLKVAKAAELLGMLPGPRARKITYAISLTGSVAPDAVQKIGISIAGQLDAQPAKAFSDGPVERVGAILNFSPSGTRDDVLAGLEETDQGFADEVRKSIFTFVNIATRIDARDVPKIVREVDATVLIKALQGAKGEGTKSAEFILSNMSQRMAQGLRDEMAALGSIKEKDAEEAQTAVVAAIRELEGNGEIFLLTGDDDA